jgi:hypothetical protein
MSVATVGPGGDDWPLLLNTARHMPLRHHAPKCGDDLSYEGTLRAHTCAAAVQDDAAGNSPAKAIRLTNWHISRFYFYTFLSRMVRFWPVGRWRSLCLPPRGRKGSECRPFPRRPWSSPPKLDLPDTARRHGNTKISGKFQIRVRMFRLSVLDRGYPTVAPRWSAWERMNVS